jgi:hypothetical protein
MPNTADLLGEIATLKAMLIAAEARDCPPSAPLAQFSVIA